MTTQQVKKHPCPDCRACQQCSDSRCRVCQGQGCQASNSWSGLSLVEQIALYDSLNPGVSGGSSSSC